MPVIDEKTIRKLNKAGKVSGSDGEKLKSSIFKRPAKSLPSPEERTVKTLERICEEIAAVAKSNSGNLAILAQMINKMNIGIPETPKPPVEWEHVIVGRDNDGWSKRVISKAIK